MEARVRRCDETSDPDASSRLFEHLDVVIGLTGARHVELERLRLLDEAEVDGFAYICHGILLRSQRCSRRSRALPYVSIIPTLYIKVKLKESITD